MGDNVQPGHERADTDTPSGDDVTEGRDEAALTSHFDSGRVPPGFSSPAAPAGLGDWASAGGIGIGIGSGTGAG